ncbi:MAG: 1-acyl-sn-glycerol-3-phosphate acyltransferase [Clostridia bacterium]|nr:1-acyl-sn-glycerol-3-phosphate acyltransferase [Clostridia bacterium]
MANEAVTEKDSGIYRVARVLATVLFGVLMPVRYEGKENLAGREGPMVIISNHIHALDPLVLAYPVKSQCVFLGKKELGKNAFFRRILTSMHCILVDRGATDMEAMRACMKALKMKKVLVIFPEGTRHHEGQMEQIENGTSLLVLRGKAPLIPVYLDRPLKFFRVCHARVGDPIAYEDLLGKGINVETCEELNQRMRETYRRMILEAKK